jgi:hypothetical protein
MLRHYTLEASRRTKLSLSASSLDLLHDAANLLVVIKNPLANTISSIRL